MTESKPSRRQFVKGWTQGVFRVQIIADLSQGDQRDTGTMVPAVHDIGLHAGQHAKSALVGHGYNVREVTYTQPVPETLPGQAEIIPIGTLDRYGDGTLVYTTERAPLLTEAQRTASVADPTTQALTTPAREFEIQVFTGQSFEDIVKSLAGEADLRLAS